MKTIIILVLAFTFSLHVFATSQAPDVLIYKGNTIPIFANPLEEYTDFDSFRYKLFGDKEGDLNTACWRGYIAEWEIIDDQLYLTGIFSCSYYRDKLQSDLTDLFGTKCIDEKVKADWFTGDILSPQGELLYEIDLYYQSSYERELEFHFEKGMLTGTTLYDNSKSKKSAYSHDYELLKKYIYSNIRSDVLPTMQDSIVKIYVKISANEDGIIDDVEVIDGYNEAYEQEVIRVMKSIPEWDVYIKKGKLVRVPRWIPVYFVLENKLYSKE